VLEVVDASGATLDSVRFEVRGALARPATAARRTSR
jgi:hypothetical protein